MSKFRLSIFIPLAFFLFFAGWAFAEEGPTAQSLQPVHLQWSFKGETFNFKSQFAKEDCEYYRNRPHPQGDTYTVYATDQVDDPYITKLANQFQQWMNQMDLNQVDRVNFVAAFTQSLTGVASDTVANADNYPQYPLETMIEQKGDCEDAAILAAALLKELDYEVVFIRIEGHLGLGVVCEEGEGSIYYENGIEYIYLETTAQGWELGQIPPQYFSSEYEIFSLAPQPAIAFEFTYNEIRALDTQKEYEIIVTVRNQGSAKAENVKVICSFTTEEEGQVYAEVFSEPVSLTPEETLTSRAKLFVPKNVETQILVAVNGDNFAAEKMTSDKMTIE